jgi:hypothetical protein
VNSDGCAADDANTEPGYVAGTADPYSLSHYEPGQVAQRGAMDSPVEFRLTSDSALQVLYQVFGAQNITLSF